MEKSNLGLGKELVLVCLGFKVENIGLDLEEVDFRVWNVEGEVLKFFLSWGFEKLIRSRSLMKVSY